MRHTKNKGSAPETEHRLVTPNLNQKNISATRANPFKLNLGAFAVGLLLAYTVPLLTTGLLFPSAADEDFLLITLYVAQMLGFLLAGVVMGLWKASFPGTEIATMSAIIFADDIVKGMRGAYLFGQLLWMVIILSLCVGAASGGAQLGIRVKKMRTAPAPPSDP